MNEDFVQGLEDGFRGVTIDYPPEGPTRPLNEYKSRKAQYALGNRAGLVMRREMLSEVSRSTNAQGYGR